MAKRGTKDLAVGVMFALALVALSLTIMAVGGESRLFVKKSSYSVIFPTAEGLVVGSPVKMAGVQVGTVSKIQLSTDPQHSGIDVMVGVDRAYAARVRTDSQAALRVLQLLSGEKFVEIIPGSPGSPPLAEGSEIKPQQDPAILEQAALAAENLNVISVSLRNVLGALERGEGLMGQMITDPEFGKEGLESLVGAFKNMKELTDDLQGGSGLIGRLLHDDELSGRLDDVAAAVQSLASVSETLSREEGAIGDLLREGGESQQAIADLRAAAASLKVASSRLESGEGLFGRLLNDTEYSEGVARDLQAITGNLAEITGKINRGEGTLGALVNERTVHDGMEQIVAGVNDSKFARWLTRRYRKKGIKVQEKQPVGAP